VGMPTGSSLTAFLRKSSTRKPLPHRLSEQLSL
jgi:hypothetical protein